MSPEAPNQLPTGLASWSGEEVTTWEGLVDSMLHIARKPWRAFTVDLACLDHGRPYFPRLQLLGAWSDSRPRLEDAWLKRSVEADSVAEQMRTPCYPGLRGV